MSIIENTWSDEAGEFFRSEESNLRIGKLQSLPLGMIGIVTDPKVP